jgi:hypothetical protein
MPRIEHRPPLGYESLISLEATGLAYTMRSQARGEAYVDHLVRGGAEGIDGPSKRGKSRGRIKNWQVWARQDPKQPLVSDPDRVVWMQAHGCGAGL